MENIYRQFALDGLPISCARYGSGHINETYLLVTSRPHLYILQKINSYVFHNASGLMDNIIAVTDALRRQDPDPRHVLTLVPTLDGKPYLTAGEGEYWRLYEFVTDSLCLDKPESVDDLKQSGVETTIVELSDHLIAPLDFDMACEVHAYLRSKGVGLMRRTTVTGFSRQGDRLFVSLQDARPLPADLVILATGVTPETTLAKEAGLELGLRGAIVVDEHMRTSNEDIYAVGDAVQVRHFVSGAPVLLPLAGPANKQGRIAADNICGKDSRFEGSQGSSIVKIFDMTVATTGLNETSAKAQGLPCDKVRLYSASHATYYPGATNMSIKVVFSPQDGKILGAQIVGFEGVDKRIDVLATAIRAGMTDADLAELELSYAPPYSSAKDPVNMAGFVIGNVRDGLVRQVHWDELLSLPKDAGVRLDVRRDDEYARGHMEGALHIPLDELRSRLGELPKGKPFYVCCQSGLRSYIACRMLTQHGMECYNLSGGYRFFEMVTKDLAYDPTPCHPCGVPIG